MPCAGENEEPGECWARGAVAWRKEADEDEGEGPSTLPLDAPPPPPLAPPLFAGPAEDDKEAGLAMPRWNTSGEWRELDDERPAEEEVVEEGVTRPPPVCCCPNPAPCPPVPCPGS